MSITSRRRALAAVVVLLGCYVSGLALIVIGGAVGHGMGRGPLIVGLAILALGATASFLAKIAVVFGVPESRGVFWTNASVQMRAYRIVSLALWALPALGFWLLFAREIGH